MKASELLKCYKALVHLYDAIMTDDAYLILKRYYPNLLKKELYADLKTRVGKLTRYYAVYTTDDHNYLICNDFMNFDDVNNMFSWQEGKSYYIPETLEEFLAYAEPTYVEENDGFKIMENHMIKVFKFDKVHADVLTKIMVARIQNGFRLQESVDDIERYYEFKNQDDIMMFARAYQILNNNTRMASNKGHTPLELSAEADTDIVS